MCVLEKFERLNSLEDEILDIERTISATEKFYSGLFGDRHRVETLLLFLQRQLRSVGDVHRAFAKQEWDKLPNFDFIPRLNALVDELYRELNASTRYLSEEISEMYGGKKIRELRENLEKRRNEHKEAFREFVKACGEEFGNIGRHIRYGEFLPDKSTLSRLAKEFLRVGDDVAQKIAERIFAYHGVDGSNEIEVATGEDGKQEEFSPQAVQGEFESVNFRGIRQSPRLDRSRNTIMLEASCDCTVRTSLYLSQDVEYRLDERTYKVADLSVYGTTKQEAEFVSESDLSGHIYDGEIGFYNQETEIEPIVVKFPEDVPAEDVASLLDMISADFSTDFLAGICEKIVEANEKTLHERAQQYFRETVEVNVELS